MSLTIQIVVKNNEKTLKNCLDSLALLNGKIRVLDIGSHDNSIDICHNFHAEVIKCSLNNNYSKLRNDNMDHSEWFMWIQPWEEIISGHQEINLITSQFDYIKCFDFKTINKTIISRETKLWHKDLNISFKNRVFETPNYKNSTLAENITVKQNFNQRDFNELKNVCLDWKKEQPLVAEPIYYEAYLMLLTGQYKEFCHLAEHYLFRDTKDMADILMRYNLAQVQIYQQKEFHKGVNNLLNCLLFNPAISEFWCMLGDAFYQMNELNKAIIFYENAIIAGEKRELDYFPLDISKYKDYPLKMIKNCENMISNSKYYFKI